MINCGFEEVARKPFTSFDVSTSSTSYLLLSLSVFTFIHLSTLRFGMPYFSIASLGDNGRPDQTTSSGLIGGMKRVNFSFAISYVT